MDTKHSSTKLKLVNRRLSRWSKLGGGLLNYFLAYVS